MFKGKITKVTPVTANTNIPLDVEYNTNNNTAFKGNTNTVSVIKPGFYSINGQLVVTDVAVGDISAQLYVNGEIVPEATSTATVAATTDFSTLPITDMIRVVPTTLDENVEVSIQLNVAASISSAVLIVERIR